MEGDKLSMAIRRTEEMARKIWQTAQKEHEKLVNPVTTDNPDFDKAWNEDRLLQRLDDSESKMSIGEYAKYWFQKGQEYAQPKWTLCKDKMPDYDKPCLLKVKTFNGESAEITILCGCRCPYTPTEDEIGYGHTIDVFYIDIIDVTGNTDAVQIDDIDDVIAWMPLPEASND